MFETVLAGPPVPRRTALAGPLSIALHAAALAAVVIGSAWRISDPGEPNVPLVFLPANPPPPPGPAAATTKGVDRRSESAVRAVAASAPIAAPVAIPVRIDSAPDVGPLDLEPAGAGAGPGSGLPDGVEGGTGDLPSGTGTGDPISATAPDVVPPRLIFQAQPEYPEAARRARLQGAVLLQAVIGTSGLVEDVRIVSSASPLFEEAAIRALQQWRYAPATLARRAVRVYLTVTMNFTLH
jgi:protein TonB